MTPKARRSYEIVFNHELAHRIVRLLKEGMKAFDRSLKFPDGSKQEAAALDHAKDLFNSAGYELGWLACTNLPLKIHSSRDKLNHLSRVLRDIALAVQGKLHSKNKMLDDILISAWREQPGHVKHDGSVTVPDDFYKRVKAKCDRKGITPAPTLYAAKRRLKQLGCCYPWRKNCHGSI
jgi:hypothetical protein